MVGVYVGEIGGREELMWVTKLVLEPVCRFV